MLELWSNAPAILALRVLAIALLVVAAWRDIATRLIPDSLCIALALSGLAVRAALGWEGAATSLGLGLLVFAILLVLVARGALGGGDAKLMGAMICGLSPFAAWEFVFVTALAGGVLALPYLLGHRLVPAVACHGAPPPRTSLVGRVLAVEARRLRRRGPLPYAVAIALGGILVILSYPTGA